MKNLKIIILTLVIAAAAGILGAVIFIFSGIYNIAANEPHNKLTLWMIDEMRERSVEVRAEGIDVGSLNDPGLVELGFSHYHDMCQDCHGGPGYDTEEFAQGLYPRPPSMAGEDAQELSDAELYWIIKNGLKMTGMPEFGSTHSEKALRALVAFTRRIPKMEVKEYEDMVNKLAAQSH